MNSLLASMLPDSQIAKSFRLSKTKFAYYIVYGLASYYKEELLQKFKALPAYFIFFDESLNNNLQHEQLDVHIHFWDKETIQVQTHYLDSHLFK